MPLPGRVGLIRPRPRRESQTLRRFQSLAMPLLPRRGNMVVGVSGGADSMALLMLLCQTVPRAAERVLAVHVHHGLRARAADADARAVVAQCGRLGVACLVARRHVRAEARQRRMSLEEAGRLARQECLVAAARLWQSRAVLLAHHQDDQAETLLLNLLRGAGSRGLAGLRPSRPFPHPMAPAGLKLLRPLLPFTRRELRSYLRSLHAGWREDRSNQDPAFLRNRIRHELLPYLERRFNPRVRTLLARSADILSGQADAGRERAQRWRQRLLAPAGAGTWRLKRRPLQNLPAGARLEILSAAWDFLQIPGKTFDHLQRLARSETANRILPLPGQWRVAVSPQAWTFQSPAGRVARKNPAPAFGVKIQKISVPKKFQVSRLAKYIIVDADKVKLPLWIRTRRSGDRMQPLGLHGQHKSLKKIMSEMNIPSTNRAAWPILLMNKEIIWVFQGPMAESVKLDPASRKALKITIGNL